MKKLIFLIPFILLAYKLELKEILTKPKSYVRDFYLTEFMRETKSLPLAYKAYKALYKPKMKHLKLLAKFPEFKEIYRCVNPYPKDVGKVDISCLLNNGLSLRSFAKLNKKTLADVYNKLPPSKVKRAVNILLTKQFKKVFSSPEMGYYFILHYPTRKIDQYISSFAPFYGKYFSSFVRSAYKNNLIKIQKSLNKISYKHFSDKTKWWLFMIAMKLNDEKRAKNILKSMKKTSKVNFWLWQLSGESKYLEKLSNNPRVDFYTLYAHEITGKNFKIRNKIIFNSVKKPKYDQTNPWDVLRFWSELKWRKNLYDFANELDNVKSEALKAIVLDKMHKYKINYFITPKMYEDKNKSFKAYVYAIARQESLFIPASVSRSYALGAMQMMPFLVRAMGGDVFKQFDYNQNIKLATKHLKWLFKHLKDPLMVAYAYNGGIGFVKRKVLPRFKYKGKYEPFWSMENVAYEESKEYGKKVLANYVIYSQMFGKDITLHKLLGKKIEKIKKKNSHHPNVSKNK